MSDVEITELEKIDADRVDGVRAPASGIPILLMKALAKGQRDCPKCDKSYDADHQGSKCENCGADLPDAPDDAAKSLPDWHADAVALVKKAMTRGKVDETPDIDGGQQAIALVGKLIGYEAQELAAGNLGEAADIALLSEAAQLLRQWVSGESAVQDGNVMPATALMQSAAETAVKAAQLGIISLSDAAGIILKDRNYSAAERKEMAGDGRALPDGSYPINDEHDLNSAAILARSGHGDVDAAKKHIGKRAKELGVKNPLDNDQDDASKSRIADDPAIGDTDHAGQLEQLGKSVEDLTKALAAEKERNESLAAELAKVKATPVPGGPMMTAVAQRTADRDDEAVRKAIETYEFWAQNHSDPSVAGEYRTLAARERAKLTAS